MSDTFHKFHFFRLPAKLWWRKINSSDEENLWREIVARFNCFKVHVCRGELFIISTPNIFINHKRALWKMATNNCGRVAALQFRLRAKLIYMQTSGIVRFMAKFCGEGSAAFRAGDSWGALQSSAIPNLNLASTHKCNVTSINSVLDSAYIMQRQSDFANFIVSLEMT